MNSLKIYEEHGQELYFYILKKVQDKEDTNDIFQSVFLKIHKNILQLENHEKARSWAFQICRNEISNHFNHYSKQNVNDSTLTDLASAPQDICCFDRFIKELPDLYKGVIELAYLEGKQQEEIAKILNISLANVKARIRRSKAILKSRFQECCKFSVNEKGKLTGTPDCEICFHQ